MYVVVATRQPCRSRSSASREAQDEPQEDGGGRFTLQRGEGWAAGRKAGREKGDRLRHSSYMQGRSPCHSRSELMAEVTQRRGQKASKSSSSPGSWPQGGFKGRRPMKLTACKAGTFAIAQRSPPEVS
ncbi:hypothetical protein XA68_10862 [Ophiocordyceps unilateralis]|uniref:Uncharacterized protein n=1 Tax=Ophiocordyceps unilateralis TaxID=268505 RepID=A0A2A9P2H3_OPHUN|nr:hypothetical protein XA68_10862 [Ophiocordyceps unilateralis]